MIITIRREMTITHADFFRLLPKALRNRNFTVSGERIVIDDPAGMVEISLSPEKIKQIAALSLPVTVIEFVFRGFLPDQVESFMTSFDLSYQKGGG